MKSVEIAQLRVWRRTGRQQAERIEEEREHWEMAGERRTQEIEEEELASFLEEEEKGLKLARQYAEEEALRAEEKAQRAAETNREWESLIPYTELMGIEGSPVRNNLKLKPN